MTQAKSRFATFEEYLSYTNITAMTGYYHLIEGELVALPPESEPNISTANLLFLIFVNAGISYRLVQPGRCEVQVPVLEPKDPANRYPDLVILRSEHLQLTQKRLTITREMPPPRLVVEVVSPGRTNRDRDYIRKRAQYEALGIPEYWLIDLPEMMVTVLELTRDGYQEVGTFQGNDRICSIEFDQIEIIAEQVLVAGKDN